MSEPVSNAEIEDVLSSIRRLVAGDRKGTGMPRKPMAIGPVPVPQPEPPVREALFLSPSLRVEETKTEAAPEPAVITTLHVVDPEPSAAPVADDSLATSLREDAPAAPVAGMAASNLEYPTFGRRSRRDESVPEEALDESIIGDPVSATLVSQTGFAVVSDNVSTLPRALPRAGFLFGTLREETHPETHTFLEDQEDMQTSPSIWGIGQEHEEVTEQAPFHAELSEEQIEPVADFSYRMPEAALDEETPLDAATLADVDTAATEAPFLDLLSEDLADADETEILSAPAVPDNEDLHALGDVPAVEEVLVAEDMLTDEDMPVVEDAVQEPLSEDMIIAEEVQPAAEESAAEEASTQPEPTVELPITEEVLSISEETLLSEPEPEPEFDDTALRALIAGLIQQELQGVLGERITRNIRKLVREEIRHAISDQDIG